MGINGVKSRNSKSIKLKKTAVLGRFTGLKRNILYKINNSPRKFGKIKGISGKIIK